MWGKIAELNMNVPAPLDEKSMYALSAPAMLQKSSQWCADFYNELYDEVKDRVDRGIAAVENEQARFMSDGQPPWSFLRIFRYLEKTYGIVSIGSIYTFGHEGMMDYNREKDTFSASPLPNEKPVDREVACYELAKWHLHKPMYQGFYHCNNKSEMMACIARNWKADGIMFHYNRGCEGTALGIAENRLYLLDQGFPVLTFEGNMGDAGEFDEKATLDRFDIFVESRGIKPVSS